MIWCQDIVNSSFIFIAISLYLSLSSTISQLCGIAHRSTFSHTYSQTCTHQTGCPFFTAGFQVSGEWGRGVQQGSVGSDEDWDWIGREEPFLLSALLQCCHGTPLGELQKSHSTLYIKMSLFEWLCY